MEGGNESARERDEARRFRTTEPRLRVSEGGRGEAETETRVCGVLWRLKRAALGGEISSLFYFIFFSSSSCSVLSACCITTSCLYSLLAPAGKRTIQYKKKSLRQ
ncbi:hypothetical protein LX32DRAFT_262206 [Colletotrichum zoysiae]|uniref:Uncharacterized protein n=1 Tax=Colletotrichum zoysiae TaxID=1216348 RepID=A0AAD9HMH5_9PEZI|nr:hypothetical protein LX32DRAFT_262206 [Colletotrichum zoysiae]